MSKLTIQEILLFGVRLLLGFSLVLVACTPERDVHDQLIVASRTGDIGKVKRLIQNGADVNAHEKVGEGHTAIFNAASAGHTEVVRFLIEKGAKVNEPSGKMTPLIVASWAGHTESVRVLLQAGADPNAKDENGWTALMHAARKGYVEIGRFLVENGADVTVRLADGNTALSWAKATNNNAEMVEILKRANAPQ